MIFKYSNKDAFLVLQTLFVISISVVFSITDPAFIWWVLALPVQILLMLSCSNTSVHHHSHWATFLSKKANAIYECLLALVGLSPLQVYRNSHLIHHKFVNDPPVSKDPISVLANGKNGEAENLWKFCAGWMVRTNFLYSILSIHSMPLANHKQWKLEMIASSIFVALLVLINFQYAIWFFFVVCPGMQFFNAAWHYGEHWGAHSRRGDTTQDSVGIYSWWYNTFCFNSGLHQEHHHKPGVHWSELSKVTPLLHPDRVIVKGMHILNVPWRKDFVKLYTN